MPSRPQAIYDARPLDFPKITILSLQHLFAMFGTTILVPTMVGLPVASTLFFAGMGTLIFHWITKGKVASVMEHIGDIFALSSTSHRNFLSEPGLHRTLCGDGVATIVASLFGAPANTTYSQNTGALTLTRVFDPLVVRGTAIMAILLSFCPKVSAVIQVMPEAVLGGVCLLLFGTISSVGISNLVENKVNMSDIRNVAIVSMVLTLAVGIKYGSDDQLVILGIPVSGMAIATICGILLNLCVIFFDKKKAKNTPQPSSQDTV